MPSSNGLLVRAKIEEIYNGLPGTTNHTMDVTIPNGFRQLSLELYNNTDAATNNLIVMAYGFSVQSFNSWAAIASYGMVLAAGGGVGYFGPGGNAAGTLNGLGLGYLTPGQVIRIFVGFDSAPSSGTFQVKGYWTN